MTGARITMDSNGVSPGEVGGVFAGLVALLAAIGKGIAWMLGWQERQDASRSAKLDAWHKELAAKEERLDAETEARFRSIETELIQMKADYSTLGTSFVFVATDLHGRDPKAYGLAMARKLLGDKFPLHLRVPDDLAELAREAEAALDGGGK